MKTRLISPTMVLLFAALTLTGTANNRTDNSSSASRLENITEQFSDFNYCCPSAETTMMEVWIDSRDQWEQIGQESTPDNSVMDSEVLEDWMVSRDTWEQQDMKAGNTSGFTSVLEQWTDSADNWEQK